MPVFDKLTSRCLLALLLWAVSWACAATPVARSGELDLSQWDFAREGIVSLDGDWDFVPGRLLAPDEPWPADAGVQRVPGNWARGWAAGHGAGTYRLRVACRADQPLALALPFQQTAAAVFVNGRQVGAQGRPAPGPQAHVPAIRSDLALLDGARCPLELRAQVSNFELYRGGLMRSIQLGTRESLMKRRELALLRTELALGAVLIVGLFSLMFYLARPRERLPLHFALFCLCFGLILGLSGERALQPLVEWAPFQVQMRALFANWYLGLAMYAMLMHGLYPRQVNPRVLRGLTAVSLAGVTASVVLPLQWVSYTSPALQAGGVGVGVWVAWVLARAWRARERGAVIVAAGLGALVASGLHDVLFYQHLLSASALPYGLVCFVLAPGVLLAQRLARALSAEERHAIEQRGRADFVVRAARVGIVDWDGHTHATWYSPRFREIRGFSPDADTAGWPDYFKVMIHPEDRERITRRWVAFIKGEGPEGPRGEYYAAEEYRLLRADGSYVWVEVSGMAVRDARGFVVRWIAAIIDITERRAQRELLERQNEALKENVRLREEVERIGRHDLKTPLNSIVAVPRLLREERKLGAEADELLGIVERAGYRILSMVNLSLDLYKMEQGSYVFRPDAVDLADLAHKVIADVRMHAASKQVRLQLQAWQAPYAWAEELLCYSLMANLLKNAVEASPEGGVVGVVIEAAEGGAVRVRIHNRGAVPEAIRERFFSKYTTLGKASGTGLGTYSAWLMAKVQDGSVSMQTSEDSGTTISVTLRGAPAGKVPAALRHAAERRVAEPAALAALPPTRVLLVDDDEYNLLIVRRFLPSPPFVVDTAINGRVALANAELQWPDLVFMDLDMPVMGGLEAVVKLRELQRRAIAGPCTIVALSSHEDEATRRRALAAGFDAYLTKPVTREAVHAVVLEQHATIGGDAPPARTPAIAPPPARPEAVWVDPDIAPILEDFIASRRELLARLREVAGHEDRGEVRRIAHLLAGSFALYGFGWASERSRWLEGHFSEVPADAVRDFSDELGHHLETVQIRFGDPASAGPLQ